MLPLRPFIVLIAFALSAAPLHGQAHEPQAAQSGGRQQRSTSAAPRPVPPSPDTIARSGAVPPAGVTPPPGYTIGPDDVLIVVFWQEKEMSGEVMVRPDGKISLPLVNETQAAGLTPDQLRANLQEAAEKFLQEPNVTVVVKTINSLRVFITGMVSKPGPYSLTSPTTVLQLIATAGGLLEYADREHIVIIRVENGRQTSYRFNYKEVTQQKKLGQNVDLKAGDTVLVP